MNMEIKNEKDNPYLKRKELELLISHPGAATPSMKDVQQAVAEKTKKDVTQIEVKNIFSKFGMQESLSKVFVWEDKVAPDFSKVSKKRKKSEAKEAPKENVEKKKESKPKDKKEDE